MTLNAKSKDLLTNINWMQEFLFLNVCVVVYWLFTGSPVSDFWLI